MAAEQQRRATNGSVEQRGGSGNGGPTPSDRDLVDRSRVGDRDAFDLLVRGWLDEERPPESHAPGAAARVNLVR